MKFQEIWKIPSKKWGSKPKRSYEVKLLLDGSYTCECQVWKQKKVCRHVRVARQWSGPDYILPEEEFNKPMNEERYSINSQIIPFREFIDEEFMGHDFVIKMVKLSEKIGDFSVRLEIARIQHIVEYTKDLKQFNQFVGKIAPQGFKNTTLYKSLYGQAGWKYYDYTWIQHIHIDNLGEDNHDFCLFIFLDPLDYRKISMKIMYVFDTKIPKELELKHNSLCKEIQEWVDSNHKIHLSNPEIERELIEALKPQKERKDPVKEQLSLYIRELVEKNPRELILSNRRIKELPSSICKYDSLEVLFLDNNNLESLPSCIGNLTSLVKLKVSNNSLIRLPESMGALKSLKFLYLNHNPISELPLSLKDLSSLKILNISNTNIKEIPQDIKKIETLKIIK